jgi:cell wall-associated NlpC family hydrolase
MCEIIAAPWCGCFVNACLVAAGFPSQPWLRYCPSIEGRARSGDGGWSWHSIGRARPGDLVLYGNGIAQHVELYAGHGITYGGNTSSGTAGSQDNGGGVFARRRMFSDRAFPARGVARPPYARS